MLAAGACHPRPPPPPPLPPPPQHPLPQPTPHTRTLARWLVATALVLECCWRALAAVSPSCGAAATTALSRSCAPKPDVVARLVLTHLQTASTTVTNTTATTTSGATARCVPDTKHNKASRRVATLRAAPATCHRCRSTNCCPPQKVLLGNACGDLFHKRPCLAISGPARAHTHTLIHTHKHTLIVCPHFISPAHASHYHHTVG